MNYTHSWTLQQRFLAGRLCALLDASEAVPLGPDLLPQLDVPSAGVFAVFSDDVSVSQEASTVRRHTLLGSHWGGANSKIRKSDVANH
jgi:hypothetical protein